MIYTVANMVKFPAFFLIIVQHALCQNSFAPDSAIAPGATVKLVCDVTVANFNALVTLSKDNIQKTSCDNTNACSPYSSNSGRYQYSSNASAVTVEISSLNQANDEGTWTCKVGASPAVTYVLLFPSTKNPNNKECKGSFHCGFWPVSLIDLVSSSIGAILELKEVLIIKGFFKTKEINVAIFNGVPFIVAIVIGVVLGIVMECHICGTTLGVSIGIGLFIAAIQWILITFWNCKKEYYRAVIKITSETYADDLGDCKSEAYKDLFRRVTKAIESLYKNVEGRQTVVEVNFSPGLKVTFDLGSQGFSDCSVLSGTLEIALQSGVISPFKVSSDGFKFMPLKDWKDSKGETSDRSNGDRARSPASASAIKVEAE